MQCTRVFLVLILTTIWRVSCHTKSEAITASDCAEILPAWMQAVPYRPCKQCPIVLVQSADQPITSSTRHRGVDVTFIAPYWQWNFQTKKTVIVIAESSQVLRTVTQTWTINDASVLAVSGETTYLHDVTIVYETTRQVTITTTSLFSSVVKQASSISSLVAAIIDASSHRTLFDSTSASSISKPTPFPADSSKRRTSPSSPESHILLTESSYVSHSHIIDSSSLKSSITSTTTGLPQFSSSSPLGEGPPSIATSISSQASIPLQISIPLQTSRPLQSSSFDGSSSSLSALPPPIGVGTSFRLFVRNNIFGLDELAVGFQGSLQEGSLAVGRNVTQAVFVLHPDGTLQTSNDSTVYYSQASKYMKRQSSNSLLKYGLSAPFGSSSHGFSLNGVTLRLNSDEGVYQFFVLENSMSVQSIYVAEARGLPTVGYFVDLVTVPMPIQTIDPTDSSEVSGFSKTFDYTANSFTHSNVQSSGFPSDLSIPQLSSHSQPLSVPNPDNATSGLSESLFMSLESIPGGSTSPMSTYNHSTVTISTTFVSTSSLVSTASITTSLNANSTKAQVSTTISIDHDSDDPVSSDVVVLTPLASASLSASSVDHTPSIVGYTVTSRLSSVFFSSATHASEGVVSTVFGSFATTKDLFPSVASSNVSNSSQRGTDVSIETGTCTHDFSEEMVATDDSLSPGLPESQSSSSRHAECPIPPQASMTHIPSGAVSSALRTSSQSTTRVSSVFAESLSSFGTSSSTHVRLHTTHTTRTSSSSKQEITPPGAAFNNTISVTSHTSGATLSAVTSYRGHSSIFHLSDTKTSSVKYQSQTISSLKELLNSTDDLSSISGMSSFIPAGNLSIGLSLMKPSAQTASMTDLIIKSPTLSPSSLSIAPSLGEVSSSETIPHSSAAVTSLSGAESSSSVELSTSPHASSALPTTKHSNMLPVTSLLTAPSPSATKISIFSGFSSFNYTNSSSGVPTNASTLPSEIDISSPELPTSIDYTTYLPTTNVSSQNLTTETISSESEASSSASAFTHTSSLSISATVSAIISTLLDTALSITLSTTFGETSLSSRTRSSLAPHSSTEPNTSIEISSSTETSAPGDDSSSSTMASSYLVSVASTSISSMSQSEDASSEIFPSPITSTTIRQDITSLDLSSEESSEMSSTAETVATSNAVGELTSTTITLVNTSPTYTTTQEDMSSESSFLKSSDLLSSSSIVSVFLSSDVESSMIQESSSSVSNLSVEQTESTSSNEYSSSNTSSLIDSSIYVTSSKDPSTLMASNSSKGLTSPSPPSTTSRLYSPLSHLESSSSSDSGPSSVVTSLPESSSGVPLAETQSSGSNPSQESASPFLSESSTSLQILSGTFSTLRSSTSIDSSSTLSSSILLSPSEISDSTTLMDPSNITNPTSEAPFMSSASTVVSTFVISSTAHPTSSSMVSPESVKSSSSSSIRLGSTSSTSSTLSDIISSPMTTSLSSDSSPTDISSALSGTTSLSSNVSNESSSSSSISSSVTSQSSSVVSSFSISSSTSVIFSISSSLTSSDYLTSSISSTSISSFLSSTSTSSVMTSSTSIPSSPRGTHTSSTMASSDSSMVASNPAISTSTASTTSSLISSSTPSPGASSVTSSSSGIFSSSNYISSSASSMSSSVSSSIPVSTTSPGSTSALISTTSSSTTIDAVSQATSIIVQSSLQMFCSQLLGYSTMTVTISIGTTQTQSATIIQVVTISSTLSFMNTITNIQIIYTTVPSTTLAPVVTSTVTVSKIFPIITTLQSIAARQIASSAISTPAALSTFAPIVITSACNLEASPVTSTLTNTQIETVQATKIFTITATTTVVVTTTLTMVISSLVTTTVYSGFVSIPTSTITTTSYTSTTTLTISPGAPAAASTPYYLQVVGDPKPSAMWGLSDPERHLTDNLYQLGKREAFALTPENKLYSLNVNAWYGVVGPGLQDGKIYWDPRSQYGNTTFYGRPTSDGTGRLQLFINNTATILNTQYFFCVATGLLDRSTTTGFHVYYYQLLTLGAACSTVQLYLSPVANG